jgi:hypothetical protein
LKRHELIGHLQDQGCRWDREGGRHTIYMLRSFDIQRTLNTFHYRKRKK